MALNYRPRSHDDPSGQSPLATDDGIDVTSIRAAVTHVMRTSKIPGLSLAVTRHDRLLYAEGFGLADLAADRPATPDTSYLWFSLSKIVTATAVMRLADEGRLDLDAPVREYIAAYPAITPQPRVRQLLNHTAGLANPLPIRWVRPATTDDEPDAFLARVLRKYGKPRHPVGGSARYSNLGYLLAAEVVAAVTGRPFERYVTQAVLAPAGMSATGYQYAPEADMASGYVRGPRLLTTALSALLPPGIAGERYGRYLSLRPFLVTGAGYGGLVGNVVDAARLAALHLGDGAAINGQRLLSTQSAQAMRRIHARGEPFDHGIGWFRRPDHRGSRPEFVEHYGTGAGFWNGIRLYPDLDFAITVMTNTTHAYDIHTLFTDIMRGACP
ncbi:serine hydrolase domain-containing protein [Acrocarpospora macrocephala]|uniref:Serine hydrolase n=1 Tax=Acrocarpospora macrocephala TaxID=150177 RepID=A0A5M3WX22_9ACTN|nr:serine hydrolase domain-containing protein [Acrocarpospora macrocephala]GES12956.1 serine hydrolase [Acrocarpospora macrocephala]